MFTLMSGAYRYFTRLDEYNVLVLGLDGAGKTTLLEKIKYTTTGIAGMPPEKIQPTVGVNIAKVHMQRRLVKFLDLGGQEDLQGIWSSYFSDAHAVLFVIDSSNKKRMDEALSVLLKLSSADELAQVPFLVLANKLDLNDITTLAYVKELVNGAADHLDDRFVRVLGASAISGEGVQPIIDWLFTTMVENSNLRPPLSSE
ncbi:ADP-ribosylation factor protein 3 [Coemansia guatemalensis]|uniref:ADP-ribosylation factor protein 3 n=1 Tax=Coemansia guatemalensis TaxID=2761395 RepID=A0A9W8HWF8_9FUNG|nr:ADP-ribosylation factor protein 3 [Coemansia guatemalensis]